MAICDLPLSYCTNVHPGRTLSEVEQGLDRYTVGVREQYGSPLGAGLWLAASVVRELLMDSANLPSFRDGLSRRSLSCHTLNAFPYGDFHSSRVKENVYLPDWSDRRRFDYTVDCARVLASVLPEGVEGSISTMPVAFKGFSHPDGHLDECIRLLLETAASLDRIFEKTGRLIRLAIEPEPCCLIETTDEALEFFARLWSRAEALRQHDLARRHLGLCYDVCHQAVEFEGIPESIRKLTAAGLRINKVHITCAIELESPCDNEAGRRALAHYVEERYLHQTLARMQDGRIVRKTDLTEELALHPPADIRDACAWRVHFHVPVNAERLGPLRTTRTELRQALTAVAALDYSPHLEVETYTWEVLPELESRLQAARETENLAGKLLSDMKIKPKSPNLIDGLTGELIATRELLNALSPGKSRKNS